MRTIVLGTRRSNLALTQTRWVIDQLTKLNLNYDFKIKEIVTKGDRILDVTLSKVGGKGLFVKEIEQALEDGEIDLAVHSMKDVPSVMLDGFTLAAITKREDPRDAIISEGHVKLSDLPPGSIVGTSSLRRSAQILAKRPDLEVQWIRGNVETRLRKLKEESFSAIVLAAAGLNRLGYTEDFVTEYLEPSVCVPAVGQGALGLECRSNDEELKELLAHINDPVTSLTVTAERAFLHKLEGGCQVPIAGFAVVNQEQIELTGLVGSPDGKVLIQETKTGTSPIELGESVAQALLDQGAEDILEKVKSELDS
ncbi:hydroxymethylbilane synthase [Alkalicoccobacillus murimartini]|uniref:Porphobilinogen deaminase n=1 Tax=Alkalicoccobacillus murimartini TaxID=171685 RepID=A0ABT9YLY3_9BACI|nr:hydroxymethylbilane synthase [Alkalicoccobacillus murimartini]MDQ0208019.1 hydroxymethylbilane synthase [Alkalicoccobacillus murimartini]